MTQIVAGTGPYTLTKTWAVNGTPTDVGAVTIGVVDGDGDEVVATGTATTNNADGTYTYSLADQANPDALKVTWTRSDTSADLVDRIEVTGNLLFSEIQARAFKGKDDANTANIPLASSTEYEDATIAAERTRITEDLEFWTGRGWIPRYARVEFNGNGTFVLDLANGVCRTADGYQLHRPGRLNDVSTILSVTVGGTTVATSNVKVDEARRRLLRIDNPWTVGTLTDPFNVVVEYVYGLPYLVDGVDRIGLKELVDRLVPSAWPDRATRVDTEFGNTQLIQPGGPMGNVSRIATVNDWVKRHDHRVFL